tara:strand:+ start:722 stop:1279 length:558 start_codon:yes stop_codon:yes gene_type:complete
MSLNHLIDSSVPLDQALDIKVKNIRVTGQILQATSNLSYFGGLSPTTVLPFLSEGITNASVVAPSVCTMCQQTGQSFQVGYYVTVVTPAGVTSNNITLYCPYPQKLRTFLIENDPSVINGASINSLGYSFTNNNVAHNKASLTVSGLPDISVDDKDYIRFEFHTDNGLPFTSSQIYLFKIQHTQA